MMTGSLDWGMSPILDGVRIFFALLLLAPLFVMVDSLRPWRHMVEADFNEPKEGMYGYVWMGGILFLVGLLAWVPSFLDRAGIHGVPSMPGAISGLALFFMVVLLFAYIKRVMFNPYMRRYRKEMRRQSKLKKSGEGFIVSADAKESFEDAKNKKFAQSNLSKEN